MTVEIYKTIQGTLAFLAWTVTSFLCHQSAKLFLTTGTSDTPLDNGIVLAVVITFLQMSMCYILVDIHFMDSCFPPAQNIFTIKVSCHLLATLATNYSMTLVQASSTFAIKLLEPVTSALVQYLVLGTSVSPLAFLSLPVIIGGALAFCGSSLTSSVSVLGVAMAALSNIILAFRNVAIKLEQAEESKKTIQLRSRQRLLVTGTVLVVLLLLVVRLDSRLLPRSVVFLVVTATSSSVFHVIYSYISTNIVLIYMSVVSHSVTNIFKRVLVVLMLYALGQREATLGNFTGLAFCTVGLLTYVCIQQRQKAVKPSNGTEFKQFLPIRKTQLFGCLLVCCCGLSLSASYFCNTTNFGLSVCQKYDVTNTPAQIDALSPQMTTTFDVIAEAQRIHLHLFSDLFSNYKYVMLFDTAAFENKGDPAITAGEVYLLRRLGMELVYYCNGAACTIKNLDYAKNISRRYTPDSLLILLQGGGNIVGYEFNDYLRAKVFERFSSYEIVLFPQSIYLKNDTKHLQFCQRIYQNQDNFTMILRDRQSLQLAQKYFKGKGKIMMAPDMAFQIGAVPRFISPSFDILWLKRSDGESPGYSLPQVPDNLSVHCSDWWSWKTPHGETSMETSFMVASNGLTFVQRGRVLITDRLHGHILSVLSDIPHVLIDSKNRKISAYHNTWTRGLANTLLADNATHALELAVGLLQKYNNVLPQIAPFMNVEEKPDQQKKYDGFSRNSPNYD